MKTLHIFIFIFISVCLFAQEPVEKEILTEVNEVTVFIDKAQISRQKEIELLPGTTVLKFTNLSPFIDAKSIQVKTSGNVMVLAVNHQVNFLEKPEKSNKEKSLEDKIERLNSQLTLEQTHLSIIKNELAFLDENRIVSGKNNAVEISALKEAADFYSSHLTELKMKEIERNKTLDSLNRQKTDLENQLKTLAGNNETSTSEIEVKVSVEAKTRATFQLSYLVGNAGWFPSYDIRSKSVNEPLQLVYKANVRQDTKVDWNNVKLAFSSSNPNSSGVLPELKAFYLDYNSLPPVYNTTIHSVSGKIVDSDNQPLPGVSVVVPGTTVGAVSDINGIYSITLPKNTDYLNFSFVGMVAQNLPVSSSVLNVVMKEDLVALDEVVVVGYGVSEDADFAPLQGRMAGISLSSARYKEETNAVPFEKTENQTSINFEIQLPYSVKSDNKNYSVEMTTYEIPASYQYLAVPKIEKEAYLFANITDWEKYSLLEGEANIFVEETFVGKTVLDVRFAADTLQLSLGKDKNVTVNREKEKDFTKKQFVGSKKEETIGWKISVKNNKSQVVNMVIFDQVPVAKISDIEVETLNLSGAKLNRETGEVKWEFVLNPLDKKEFELKYSVKYPKWRSLVIE